MSLDRPVNAQGRPPPEHGATRTPESGSSSTQASWRRRSAVPGGRHASPQDLERLREECLSGNDSAWEYLFRVYEPAILGRARASGLTPMECRDVLQATFISIYRGLDDQDESRRLSAWIRRIVQRRIADHLRAKLRRRSRVVPLEDLHPACHATQVERLQQRRRNRRLRQALRQLSARQRQVVLGLFFDELGYRGVSDRYGIPQGSIGPTLQRALRRLERLLLLERR